MAPARAWPRAAAWTLDLALLALPIALLLRGTLAAAGARVALAWQDVSATLARLAADALSTTMPLSLLASRWLTDAGLQAAAAALQGALWALAWPPVAAIAVASLAWHVAYEASAAQATPGQRAARLRVVDADGARLRAMRAAGRHLAGTASWLTLNVGHAMVALPARLSLHDRLSATRVVQAPGAGRLPAWMHGWLLLQGAVLLLGAGWLAVAAYAVVDAALAAALDTALRVGPGSR